MICADCKEYIVLDISDAPSDETFPDCEDWTGAGAGYVHFDAWTERLADHKAVPT